MKEQGKRFTAILFSTLMLLSMLAGGVTVDNATAANMSSDDMGGEGTTANSESVTTSDLLDGELTQSTTILPDDQSFVPGATYPLLLSTTIDSSSFLSEDSVTDPSIEVTVSDNVEIQSILPTDYSDSSYSTTTATISSDVPFEPETSHTAVVLVRIPESAEDSFTVNATPGDGDSEGESKINTYELSTGGSSLSSFADAAESRESLARSYQNRYSVLLDNEPWEENFEGSMREAFSTAIVEGTKGAAIGSTPVIGTIDDFQTSYGVSTGQYGGGAAGQIAQINEQLAADLKSQIANDEIKRAGNSSKPLTELAELYAAEQAAWERGDRDELEEILQRQQAVLFSGFLNSASNSPSGNPYVSAYDTSLLMEARDQADASRTTTVPDAGVYSAQYFDALETYARDEYDETSKRLELVRDPSPQVTTNTDHSTIESELKSLDPGQTKTILFSVKNGEAAVTGEQSYLSLSHNENLSVVDVSEVGTDESPTVDTTNASEEAFSKNGSTTLQYDLVDIISQYDTGQEREYRVTIERESKGEMWISYRAAFEPFLSEDGLNATEEQDRFSRYPQSGPTDQQGWPVHNLSTSDVPQPPRPAIDVSSEPTTADPVTLDAGPTTADARIDLYDWDIDTIGDGDFDETRTGETPSVDFESGGIKQVQLTVTDSNGQKSSVTTQIKVTDDSAAINNPRIGFTVRPTFAEPGDTLRAAASDTINGPEWSLSLDGSEVDSATGESFAPTVNTGGLYEVTLSGTVDGQQVEKTKQVTVISREQRVSSPTVRVSLPSQVDTGETIEIDASESVHPHPDRQIDRFELLVNGNTVANQSDGVFTPSFETTGERVFEIAVTGSTGNTSTYSETVSVGEDTSDSPPDDDRSGRTGSTQTASLDILNNGWTYTGGGLEKKQVAVGDQIYATTGSDVAVLSANGSELRRFDVTAAPSGPPQAISIGDQENLYISRENAGVVSYTPDGSLRWDTSDDTSDAGYCVLSSDFCLKGGSTPAVTEETVYVTATNLTHDTGLFAINRSTGDVRWKVTLSDSIVETIAPTIGPDGTVYASVPDGGLHAVTPDGAVRWSVETDGITTTYPVVTDSGLALHTTNETITAIASDGTIAWQQQSYATVPPAVSTDGRIYVPNRSADEPGLGNEYGIEVLAANGTPIESASFNVKAIERLPREKYQFASQPIITEDQIHFIGGIDGNGRLQTLDRPVSDGKTADPSPNRLEIATADVNSIVPLADAELLVAGQSIQQIDENVPPELVVDIPTRVDPGETIHLNATASTHPHPAREISSYRFDIVDETIRTDTGVYETHIDTEGIYEIDIKAVGSEGVVSQTTWDVVVESGSNLPPERKITQHDHSRNTGYAANGEPPRGGVDAQWNRTFGGSDANPTGISAATLDEAGDVAIVGLDTRRGDVDVGVDALRALDSSDGTVEWSAIPNPEEEVRITQIQHRGEYVIIGVSTRGTPPEGSVVALDAETGDRIWDRQPSNFLSFTATNQTVIIQPNRYQSTEAIDLDTGEQMWERERWEHDTIGFAQPAIQNNTVYTLQRCDPNNTGFSVFCVRALDRETGEVRWQTALNDSGRSSTPIVRGTDLYIPTNGGLYELEVLTGELRAVYEEIDDKDPLVTEEHIITDQGIYDRESLSDTDTESEVTPLEIELSGAGNQFVLGDRILGMNDGAIVAYNSKTGERSWEVSSTNMTSESITAGAGGTLLALDRPIDGLGGLPTQLRVFEGPTSSGIAVRSTEPAVGDPVNFEADINADSYAWDLTGDGEIEDNGTTVTTTYEEGGEYRVTLIAETASGEREQFVRELSVSEQTHVDIDTDSRYPLPSETVTFSAVNVTAAGNVTYTWYQDNEQISDCSGSTCEFDVGTDTSNITVQTVDSVDTSANASITIRPVDINVDVGIDGVSPDDAYDDVALINEDVQIFINSNKEGNTSIEEIKVDGPATILDNNSRMIGLDETGTVEFHVKIAVEGVNSTISRSHVIDVVEFHEELEHFTFGFEPGTDTRETRVGLAILQTEGHLETVNNGRDVVGAETMYMELEQRNRGLPGTIHVRVEDRSRAAASRPNRIALTESSLEIETVKIETTFRHELAHTAGYELNAESRNDWNFVFEGHAMYEQQAATHSGFDRLALEELQNWNGSHREYRSAAGFVQAMYAEFGRQTVLELLEDSYGTDLATEFESTTGESLSGFHDTWQAGGTEGHDIEQLSLKPMFVYDAEETEIRAIQTERTVYRQNNDPYVSTERISVNVSWDLTGDGTIDREGETINWKPTQSGANNVTIQYEHDGVRVSQTQTIYPQNGDVNNSTDPDNGDDSDGVNGGDSGGGGGGGGGDSGGGTSSGHTHNNTDNTDDTNSTDDTGNTEESMDDSMDDSTADNSSDDETGTTDGNSPDGGTPDGGTSGDETTGNSTSGFGAFVALVALIAAALVARRRSR